MSNKMITAAWDVPLPAHARLVLIALADSASDDEGVCWIKNKTIMNKSTCAKTTLGYILFTFERLGIIRRETRFRPENGSQTSSLKRIVIPIFEGSKKEVEAAKSKFATEYEAAYFFARKKKDTPSHHVTGGEGSQGDLPHTTQGDLPPVTQCDPLYEPSVKPSVEFEEEEEVRVGEVVTSMTIPAQLCGLSEDEIRDAVKELSLRKRPSDPVRYEEKLYLQIESADRKTCLNILKILSERSGPAHEKPWEREKRLKRERGESFQLALLGCGFNNPGEAYTAMKGEDQNDF